MNDNWWAIGETLRAREQEIRSLFERAYLRGPVAGGRPSRRAQRRGTVVGAVRPGAQPCC